MKFNFELNTEEADDLSEHLHDYLNTRMMNIIDCMASDKDEETKKAEIKWYIGNMEWFLSIIKKVGFDSHYDEAIQKLKQRYFCDKQNEE